MYVLIINKIIQRGCYILIIEKLKFQDIMELLELYKELMPFEIEYEKSAGVYKEITANENYILLVAKEENEILGSMLGIRCKSLLESFLVIEAVIVKEKIRGKGVGRKLMEKMDEFAKEKNCAYAILVSSDFREGAHKFYERLGFKDGVKGFRKLYY
ncbi:hypothetical protein CLFE_031110 [Clostridium felsineum DSM 794]|nr:hypothetical protein CLFE_031110 [Clostridium felsineum DSM 794]